MAKKNRKKRSKSKKFNHNQSILLLLLVLIAGISLTAFLSYVLYSIVPSQASIQYAYITSNNDSLLPAFNLSKLKTWKPKEVLPLNPSSWPGENGIALQVPEDKHMVDRLFKLHYFNILASDRIALNRYIEDKRHPNCLSKIYPKKLPTASVVIVFHNEAWSTLLRTVYSVINTSPNELVREIILVDDKSSKVYLKRQLEDYLSTLNFPIKVIRQGKRQGLVKARLLGASQAKGQVLVFIDSHCECNEGWLEPLLSRIVEDRSRVVAPTIDAISDRTFEIKKSAPNIWGGFDWMISFRWYSIPQRELERVNFDPTSPIRTPTIAGGIFAIDKELFYKMGEYDPNMKTWGSENLELSFRMWLCGASLEIIPCSRVAHVFRVQTPYTFMGDRDFIVQHNTARLVEVWLDEWTQFYYTLNPRAKLMIKGENLTERHELRKKLNCKTFKWYLDNIYLESSLPKTYKSLGQIENRGVRLCLDGRGEKGSIVSTAENNLKKCYAALESHLLFFHQTFMFTNDNRLVHGDFCLTTDETNKVYLRGCSDNEIKQIWDFSESNGHLINRHFGLCLDRNNDCTVIAACDNLSLTQFWIFHNNFRWQSPFNSV